MSIDNIVRYKIKKLSSSHIELMLAFPHKYFYGSMSLFSSLVTVIISFEGIRTWIPSDVPGRTISQCRYCTEPTLWQMPFLFQIGHTVPSSSVQMLQHPDATVLFHDKIKTRPLISFALRETVITSYYFIGQKILLYLCDPPRFLSF